MPSLPDKGHPSNSSAGLHAWSPVTLATPDVHLWMPETIAQDLIAVWEAEDLPPQASDGWEPLTIDPEQDLADPAAQSQPAVLSRLPATAESWLPTDITTFESDAEDDLTDDMNDPDSSPSNQRRQAQQAFAQQILEQAEREAHEAQQRAVEIIHQAEAQAAILLQHAQAQAEGITRQAYDQGVSEAHAETAELLRVANTLVAEVEAWRENQFAQNEIMLLRMVIEIAQTIFGDGLPLDPETLGQTFSRALAEAKILGNLRIYLHPDDAAVLNPHWLQRQTAMSGQQIELVPSDIIKRGGCYIEGQYGSVDARVETQFHLVEETLLGEAPAAGDRS